MEHIRAAETIKRRKQYVSFIIVNVPDQHVSRFITELLQSLPAMMAVNYLKALAFRPNNYRLVSAGSLDVANQLCKNLPAHPIRIVRMSNELFDRQRLNFIFHNYPSKYLALRFIGGLIEGS